MTADLATAAQRVVTHARKAAGCTRSCLPSWREVESRPVIRVTHNGVSFAHRVYIDQYFLRAEHMNLGEAILTRWLREHHEGRDGCEIVYGDDPAGVQRVLWMPEPDD
jgi:hypothetical protein